MDWNETDSHHAVMMCKLCVCGSEWREVGGIKQLSIYSVEGMLRQLCIKMCLYMHAVLLYLLCHQACYEMWLIWLNLKQDSSL